MSLNWVFSGPGNPSVKLWVNGKRGSGKTTLIQTCVRKFYHTYPNSDVIVVSEYKEYGWESFPRIQHCSFENLSNAIKPFCTRPSRPPRHHLVVFTDRALMQPKSSPVYKCLNTLIFNGRHFNTSVFVETQHIRVLSPKLRNNMDYVALFRDSVASQLQLQYDLIGQGFGSRTAFDTSVNALQPFESLFINLDERTVQNHSTLTFLPPGTFIYSDKVLKYWSKLIRRLMAKSYLYLHLNPMDLVYLSLKYV
jgi:GTPase SAR1 family protein